MATSVQGGVGRKYTDSQTTTLKKDIAFTQSGNLSIGWLPAGASVLRCTVHVKTAFNAATTNTISVGNGVSATAFANALAGGAVALVAGTIVAAQAAPAIDTEVLAIYTQAGAAPTAGLASVIIEYAV
jgi:hypothetical protein